MKNENYELDKVTKIESIRDILNIACDECPEKQAFKYKVNKQVVSVSYKEFRDDTYFLGTALTDLGMINKHVAVIGENSYKWLTVYLTMLQSNGVCVPVDKELPCDEIINVVKNSDSEVLFFSKKYVKFLDEFKKNLTNVKYFINFDLENDEDGVLSFDSLKEKGKQKIKKNDLSFVNLKTNENDLRLLVFTSGTTGVAKGVMLSEKNLVSCVYYGLQVSRVYETALSILPYHHTYEAVAGILVGLHHHATICINDNLKNVLKNLNLFKPDYIYVVPAFAELFYKKIWNNAKESKKEKSLKILIKISNFLRKIGIDKRKKFFKSIHEAFGGNLIKIVCGGAPIRPEIGKFFDDIGINLINGYGITECSPLVSANRDYFNDCLTVGVKLPCVDLKFENIDSNGNGEICVKGDTVMLGYYKNEALTNEVKIDGWFNTGDYGRLNEKGQLLITGRKKNLIVLKNGKNVFPEEIENYLMNIPYIQEVVVRGVKDEAGMEVSLLAEVFLNKDKVKEFKIEDAEKSLKKDIANQCRNLPKYKHVTEIKIRDTEFNKTTTNKIKR